MSGKSVATLSLFILLGVTCGKAVAQEKYTVDKVVAVVGNSAILYSELEETSRALVEERRKQGYTSDNDPMIEALESLLVQKLLYNQALIDSIGINSDAIYSSVESRMEQMIFDAGSVAQLEAQQGKPIFDIREDMKFKFEEMQYAQMMRMEVMSKVRVTPGEVERFYRNMDKDDIPIVAEQYIYAQITKYPKSSKAAKQRVREQLLGIRERIINGERFDLLARMYSADTGSAMQGGEMDYMPLDGFVKPFSAALAKLQVGQISEVVETEFGFHIIQLLDKKHNLYKCRHILLRPAFTPEELAESDIFLDSLVTEIRAGNITFEDAALKHSDDKYSRHNGGLVTNHELLEFYGITDTSYSSTKFFKEELYEDYYIIRNLKPGDISDSFQGSYLMGNALSKVIKLINIIPAHSADLKTDYVNVEELALQYKQMQEFETWLDKKIGSMYVRIGPEYRDGDFSNKNWLK